MPKKKKISKNLLINRHLPDVVTGDFDSLRAEVKEFYAGEVCFGRSQPSAILS